MNQDSKQETFICSEEPTEIVHPRQNSWLSNHIASAQQSLRESLSSLQKYKDSAPPEQESLFVWGSNKKGQLSTSSSLDFLPDPTQIKFNFLKSISLVSCGAAHTLILEESSQRLYGFGDNQQGQLTLDPLKFPYIQRPVQLESLTEDSRLVVTQIECSDQSSFVVFQNT